MQYHSAGVSETVLVVIVVHYLYCLASLGLYRDNSDTNDR